MRSCSLMLWISLLAFGVVLGSSSEALSRPRKGQGLLLVPATKYPVKKTSSALLETYANGTERMKTVVQYGVYSLSGSVKIPILPGLDLAVALGLTINKVGTVFRVIGDLSATVTIGLGSILKVGLEAKGQLRLEFNVEGPRKGDTVEAATMGAISYWLGSMFSTNKVVNKLGGLESAQQEQWKEFNNAINQDSKLTKEEVTMASIGHLRHKEIEFLTCLQRYRWGIRPEEVEPTSDCPQKTMKTYTTAEIRNISVGVWAAFFLTKARAKELNSMEQAYHKTPSDDQSFNGFWSAELHCSKDSVPTKTNTIEERNLRLETSFGIAMCRMVKAGFLMLDKPPGKFSEFLPAFKEIYPAIFNVENNNLEAMLAPGSPYLDKPSGQLAMLAYNPDDFKAKVLATKMGQKKGEITKYNIARVDLTGSLSFVAGASVPGVVAFKASVGSQLIFVMRPPKTTGGSWSKRIMGTFVANMALSPWVSYTASYRAATLKLKGVIMKVCLPSDIALNVAGRSSLYKLIRDGDEEFSKAGTAAFNDILTTLNPDGEESKTKRPNAAEKLAAFIKWALTNDNLKTVYKKADVLTLAGGGGLFTAFAGSSTTAVVKSAFEALGKSLSGLKATMCLGVNWEAKDEDAYPTIMSISFQTTAKASIEAVSLKFATGQGAVWKRA